MEKAIGYELRVRVVYQVDDVRIVELLDQINGEGSAFITDVQILNGENDQQKYLREVIHGKN